MTLVIAGLFLSLFSALFAEEIRVIEPDQVAQIIIQKDQTLKYAPKIESNVPGITFIEIKKKGRRVKLKGGYNDIAGDNEARYRDAGVGFHQIDNVPKIKPKKVKGSPAVKAAKKENFRIWQEQAERNSVAVPYGNSQYADRQPLELQYQQYQRQGLYRQPQPYASQNQGVASQYRGVNSAYAQEHPGALYQQAHYQPQAGIHQVGVTQQYRGVNSAYAQEHPGALYQQAHYQPQAGIQQVGVAQQYRGVNSAYAQEHPGALYQQTGQVSYQPQLYASQNQAFTHYQPPARLQQLTVSQQYRGVNSAYAEEHPGALYQQAHYQPQAGVQQVGAAQQYRGVNSAYAQEHPGALYQQALYEPQAGIQQVGAAQQYRGVNSAYSQEHPGVLYQQAGERSYQPQLYASENQGVPPYRALAGVQQVGTAQQYRGVNSEYAQEHPGALYQQAHYQPQAGIQQIEVTQQYRGVNSAYAHEHPGALYQQGQGQGSYQPQLYASQYQGVTLYQPQAGVQQVGITQQYPDVNSAYAQELPGVLFQQAYVQQQQQNFQVSPNSIEYNTI